MKDNAHLVIERIERAFADVRLGRGVSLREADVIDAYLTGLERAKDNGHDLSQIHSVASFFVSRVDSEVDARLTAIGTDEALALKFIQTVGLYPAGSVVELHSGEVGLVIETNQHARHLPRVMLVTDQSKQPRERERIVDLSLIEAGELGTEYLIKHVLKDNTHGVSLRNYREKGLVIRG